MNRLAPDDADARFIRRVLYIFVIAGVAAALYRAGNLLILAFGAMLGAIVIHAIAELYANYLRAPPKIALGLGMATVLGIVGFLVWLFGVQFRQQVNELVTALPGLIDQFAAYLSHSPVGAKIVDAIRQAYAGSKVATDVGGLVKGAGELILNCLLLLVGALFFAADPKVYERGFPLSDPALETPRDRGCAVRRRVDAEIMAALVADPDDDDGPVDRRRPMDIGRAVRRRARAARGT